MYDIFAVIIFVIMVTIACKSWNTYSMKKHEQNTQKHNKHRKIIKKKILPQYFEAVIKDEKKFELRIDEDDAQAGDYLILQEWDGKQFTGRETRKTLSYVLRNVPEYGLKEGYCIMCW